MGGRTLGGDAPCRLQEKRKRSVACFIAVDDSTDVTVTAHLAVFTPSITEDFEN
jgi:hypothetical protein